MYVAQLIYNTSHFNGLKFTPIVFYLHRQDRRNFVVYQINVSVSAYMYRAVSYEAQRPDRFGCRRQGVIKACLKRSVALFDSKDIPQYGCSRSSFLADAGLQYNTRPLGAFRLWSIAHAHAAPPRDAAFSTRVYAYRAAVLIRLCISYVPCVWYI